MEVAETPSVGGGVPCKESIDKRCSISVGAADSVSGEEGSGSIGSASASAEATSPLRGSGRVPKKFITTWRHACDKTKDRTKDLFKRWRTLPEATGAGSDHADDSDDQLRSTPTTDRGWSVHVWATWVKRYPSDEEVNLFDDEQAGNQSSANLKCLTPVQKEKLEHFFNHLFDMDRDDLISVQDFESFCERLRRFADWTENSAEFVILQQVKDGFIEHFLIDERTSEGTKVKEVIKELPNLLMVSLEDWLNLWGKLLGSARSWSDLPVWLQYFPRVLYQAINTSGSGVITRKELNTFYSSMLGLSPQHLTVLQNTAYDAMTANGEQPLIYSIYRLCFANFLLGRYPNGPGHFIFGHITKEKTSFPIDYSAMNTPPDQLEQYTPDKKTNRRSVMV